MNIAVRSLALVGVVTVLVVTSGCATIVKGSSQDVTISTDPSGAACELRKAGNSIGSVELSAFFPPQSNLEPGKRLGRIAGDMDLLAVGKRKLIWQAWVLGQERVRVPAGEFDAWKIEAVTNEVTVHGPLKITYRVWYSQAMQRAVKIHLSFDTRIDIANSSESLELAGFDKAQ